jgi:uroporphyrinogen-III synthase
MSCNARCSPFTDAPDPAPVEAWIRRAIDQPFDDLVLMTGEGCGGS